jgi:CheY-like chemotaxis protein
MAGMEGLCMTHQAPKIILLIEQKLKEAELARKACQSVEGNYELVHVREGVEALDYLHCRGQYEHRNRDKEPSLVLIDLGKPNSEGLITIREIRTHTKTHLLPVVLMASSQEELEIAKAYEYGANSYINKPRDFNEFVEILKGLIVYWFTIVKPPPLRKCPE